MLTITAFYTGILALIMVFLAYRTSARRLEAKINLGVGDDRIMEQRSRAFGNFIEFVPMMILLMAMIELQGHKAMFIHILGSAIVIARLFHALGITGKLKAVNGRFLGSLLSYIILLLAGVFLLVNGILQMM
ncbi:hypothetical protein MNBD_ALPHA01-2453 [hydrothermal vent metagenome]|uniref:Membrane protein STY2112 n=1 Tax=hydrothermal vent metagenome TaxID=652676 RepID=A0A3B0SAI8_9ZZZZ